MSWAALLYNIIIGIAPVLIAAMVSVLVSLRISEDDC